MRVSFTLANTVISDRNLMCNLVGYHTKHRNNFFLVAPFRAAENHPLLHDLILTKKSVTVIHSANCRTSENHQPLLDLGLTKKAIGLPGMHIDNCGATINIPLLNLPWPYIDVCQVLAVTLLFHHFCLINNELSN